MRKRPKLVDTVASIFLYLTIFFLVYIIVFSILLSMNRNLLIPIILISVLEVFLIFFTIRSIKKSVQRRKVFDTGTPAKARFMNFSSNVVVNGVPRYSVEYIFSRKGIEVRAKSPAVYRAHEVQYLESKRIFEIRYDDTLSVITEDFFTATDTSSPSQYYSQFNKKSENAVPFIPLKNPDNTTQTGSLDDYRTLNQTTSPNSEAENVVPEAKSKTGKPVGADNNRSNVKNPKPAAPEPDAGLNPDKLLESLRAQTSAEDLDKFWQANSASLEFSEYIKIKREYEDLKRRLE